MEAKYIFTIVIFSVALAATLGFAVAAYIKAHEDPAPLPSPDPTPTPSPGPAPVQPAAGLTKVYVTGGWDETETELLNTAESYDPSTDKWTTLASMSAARDLHALGNMTESDGKHYLYAVGGYNSSSNFLTTVEKYDILNKTWTTVLQPMLTGRRGLAVGVLTLDQKQQLYVVGGIKHKALALTTVEKYDPSNKGDTSWIKMEDMKTPRRYLAVGVLTEAFGKQYLYAVGGEQSGERLKAVEKYDPVNNTWTNVEPMLTERINFGVGVLTDSRDGKQYMYAVGGMSEYLYLDSVERYDPSTNTWTSVAPMLQKRSYHTVSVVTEDDNKQYMYAVGGMDRDNSVRLKTVERYDPFENKWTSVADMSTKRSDHARVGDDV